MNAPRVFLDGRVTLHRGDCRAVVTGLGAGSIDAVVTDPPYGLGFMGKGWDAADAAAFDVGLWRSVLRALKPGGHLVAFGGTRTYHRMVAAIENAGFEIRDAMLDMLALEPEVERFFSGLDAAQRDAFLRILDLAGAPALLAWVYGSGFPKSHDIAKAIDKRGGHHRGKRGMPRPFQSSAKGQEYERTDKGAAVLDDAKKWAGWGTALKPAWEPIVLARKPLAGTVAETVLAHGTGALNIDGCRVGETKRVPGSLSRTANSVYGAGLGGHAQDGTESGHNPNIGRWPANIVHDGSDEVVAAFPASDGQRAAVGPQHGAKSSVNAYGDFGPRDDFAPRGDSGSAARFFYSAKADANDRIGSKHPTVKPVDLMQWLCRLVTPPGGTILDPFAGTGTTGEAAFREGFKAILIEREAEYQADIARRMALCLAGPDERARASLKARGKADYDAGPLFGGDAA